MYACKVSQLLSSEHVGLNESTLDFSVNKSYEINILILVPFLKLLTEIINLLESCHMSFEYRTASHTLYFSNLCRL